MWSGALDSSIFLLLYFVISLALHITPPYWYPSSNIHIYFLKQEQGGSVATNATASTRQRNVQTSRRAEISTLTHRRTFTRRWVVRELWRVMFKGLFLCSLFYFCHILYLLVHLKALIFFLSYLTKTLLSHNTIILIKPIFKPLNWHRRLLFLAWKEDILRQM